MRHDIERETAKAPAKAFCSWSGGKDSYLALHRAAANVEPVRLVTMMIEDGSRSRSHGLREELIRAQGRVMNLPVEVRDTSWDSYESVFTGLLHGLRSRDITVGIFGDIDLQPHRDWVERVCAAADIRPVLPLWNEDRLAMVQECLDLGMDMRIVSGRGDIMPCRFAGVRLTMDIAAELETLGIDACGENGEFHTVVVDAPMFGHALSLTRGDIYERDGHWSVDFTVDGD